MADYRLYLMSVNGDILQAADIEADDDHEAIHLVRLRQEPNDVELWSGKRRVAVIPRGQPAILDDPPAAASPVFLDDP